MTIDPKSAMRAPECIEERLNKRIRRAYRGKSVFRWRG